MAENPGSAPALFRRILVATDFGESSKGAVEYAKTLALAFGSELIVLHVWQAPAFSTETYPSLEFMIQLEQAAREELTRVHAQVQLAVPSAIAQFRVGAPWSQILTTIENEQPDLVILGTHGRTGMRHVLLGSVAEKVARLSPAPVLIAPSVAGERERTRGRRGPAGLRPA